MTALISAIILAAGYSGRMEGENKLLLPFREKTVLETVVEAVLAVYLTEVIVVTGYDHHNIEAKLCHYPLRFIYNREYSQGMAASLKKGVAALASKDTAVMICLGDMPLITPELLNKLVQTYRQAPEGAIVLPVFKKRRGNPVIFSPGFREDLLGIEGDVGARSIIEKHPRAVVEVPVTSGIYFQDVDTVPEYEKIKSFE
jgi:molybdenum cofactor cytidylyltransferase